MRHRQSTRLFWVAAAVWLIPAAAGAQPSPATQTLLDQATTRMRVLQAEADQLARQSGSLLAELRALEVDREIKRQAVRKADVELQQITAAQAAAETRLRDLTSARVASTPLVAERLVAIAKRGRGGYARLLLAADDLRDMGRLSRGVTAVAELDRVRLEAHRRMLRAEEAAAADLSARRGVAAAARNEAAGARQALDAAIGAHSRRLEEIDRRRDLNARYLGELQEAHAALQRQTPASAVRDAVLPILPFRGALDWPATGRVLSRFGRATPGRLGAVMMRNGIEIATDDEQPIRAVHSGVVSYAAPFAGFGTLVILDHGSDDFSLYGHLATADVTEGVRVDHGAVVGRAGRNPSGVPSLYFELRIDGRPVDPVQWLRSPR
jgi:septal ring factor EnvC (AmiA/AmiB activator)